MPQEFLCSCSAWPTMGISRFCLSSGRVAWLSQSGRRLEMRTNGSGDETKHLIEAGKKRGYVLYSEIDRLLPEDPPDRKKLEDLLAKLDGSRIQIAEDPNTPAEIDLETSGEI